MEQLDSSFPDQSLLCFFEAKVVPLFPQFSVMFMTRVGECDFDHKILPVESIYMILRGFTLS